MYCSSYEKLCGKHNYNYFNCICFKHFESTSQRIFGWKDGFVNSNHPLKSFLSMKYDCFIYISQVYMLNHGLLSFFRVLYYFPMVCGIFIMPLAVSILQSAVIFLCKTDIMLSDVASICLTALCPSSSFCLHHRWNPRPLPWWWGGEHHRFFKEWSAWPGSDGH